MGRRKPQLKLVPIREPNGADIAQQLRRMADDIEDGVFGDVTTAMFVLDAGSDVDLFAWGLIDGMRCVGLLSLANTKLHNQTLEWLDAENGRLGT